MHKTHLIMKHDTQTYKVNVSSHIGCSDLFASCVFLGGCESTLTHTYVSGGFGVNIQLF